MLRLGQLMVNTKPSGYLYHVLDMLLSPSSICYSALPRLTHSLNAASDPAAAAIAPHLYINKLPVCFNIPSLIQAFWQI